MKVSEKSLPSQIESFRSWRGVLGIVPFGGDRGIRTPNLCDANAALSQLSYIPIATVEIITYKSVFIKGSSLSG